MNDSKKIIWKRKLNLNSGTIRVAIPIEIVEAYKLEQGQEVAIYLEGNKLIIELPK
ncbi:MAG TPA: AbrB/MazE/SpoVT family DNA-binding domain-containing protein [candidate division Zixibacteria bacterium]|nr:AbrB/MazE/SpoVT family DNA-binding domain-containing protein [candidate division Zixibacteria bacterium]